MQFIRNKRSRSLGAKSDETSIDLPKFFRPLNISSKDKKKDEKGTNAKSDMKGERFEREREEKSRRHRSNEQEFEPMDSNFDSSDSTENCEASVSGNGRGGNSDSSDDSSGNAFNDYLNRKSSQYSSRNSQLFRVPSNLRSSPFINTDKLTKLSKSLKYMINEINETNFTSCFTLINQVSENSSLSSGEYNLLVLTFLSKDLKSFVTSMNTNLSRICSQTLIDRIVSEVFKANPTKDELLDIVRNYKPDETEKTDLLRLANKIETLINAIPDSAIGNSPIRVSRKKAKLFYVKLMEYIHPALYIEFSKLRCFTKHGCLYPTMELVSNFLKAHSSFLRKNLAKKNYRFVNKISVENKLEEDLLGEEEWAKEGVNREEKFFDSPTDAKHTDTAERAKCKHCNKPSHESEGCFNHPDRAIGRKNLEKFRAKGRYFKDAKAGGFSPSCLLCRGPHISPNCRLYPQQMPISDYCNHCFALMMGKLYHPMKKCKNAPSK